MDGEDVVDVDGLSVLCLVHGLSSHHVLHVTDVADTAVWFEVEIHIKSL